MRDAEGCPLGVYESSGPHLEETDWNSPLTANGFVKSDGPPRRRSRRIAGASKPACSPFVM